MDNQHRKIKGYRELSQEEIDLMNEVKEEGVRLKALIEKVAKYNYDHAITSDEAGFLVRESEAQRWVAMAKTELQTGMMFLTRAVAKPMFF